jgi:hypothetical protein
VLDGILIVGQDIDSPTQRHPAVHGNVRKPAFFVNVADCQTWSLTKLTLLAFGGSPR